MQDDQDEGEEDDDVEDGEDGPQNRDPHFARACAIEMYVDISQ